MTESVAGSGGTSLKSILKAQKELEEKRQKSINEAEARGGTARKQAEKARSYAYEQSKEE
jgi:hypothetical protein